MKSLWTTLAAATLAAAPAMAQTVLVNQPPGTLTARASQLWQDPGPNGNDLDGDAVCWEDFVLTVPATIDHMEWWGAGACELGFRIEFWPQDPGTIAYQPLGVFYYGGDHSVHPTARFDVVPSTSPGPSGTTHYSIDLANPVSLPANGGNNPRWFVAIIGLTHQAYYTWNWSHGAGGSTQTFQFVRGLGFRRLGEGRAMLLRASGAPSVTINATASPPGSGSITGAGAYPIGTFATLIASANTGFAFLNWTENGTPVSGSSTYTFVASVNRSLVANFAPAYSITTTAAPTVGGTTTGDGAYPAGSTVTVSATPSAGYAFVNWTEFGAPVSASPTYSFPASAGRALTANFALAGSNVLFDFDNAPVHTSLPLDVVSGGITAHLSATGGGFSIQPANSLGFTPSGFGGLCIYPNSVFAADLDITFSRPMTGLSIMYSPQELGCDTSATMRVTASRAGTSVGTSTAVAPTPGTWPTGTLSLTTAQPFDRVVVHYDSRPPTCQDWGPIFLADNMIVTPAPCRADADGNGAIEPADVANFVNTWFTSLNQGTPAGDFDGNGLVEPTDVASFVNAWFTALSGGC